MKVDYRLPTLGVTVNPVKREGISIEVNHDHKSIHDQSQVIQPAPHVGVNNLYFAREDVKLIMDYIIEHGITEGIPLDMVLTERSRSYIINMYLDAMNGLQRSADGFQVNLKMLQSLDWLEDRIDSFTFESLYNETGVKPFVIDGVTWASYQQFLDNKCIYVPYVISTIPDWNNAFLAIFSVVYIGNELYKAIKQLIQWLTPTVGLGLTFPIGQVVLEILYVTLLIITLLALVEQLINAMIQPIKYHGAMLMSDMLKLVSVKLGMESESSVFDTYPFNQLAYIPEKYNAVEGNGSSLNLLGRAIGGYQGKGYTSPGYAPSTSHDSQTSGIQKGYMNGTGGDLLRLAKTLCNGKLLIPPQSHTLRLERRDYFPPSSPYQLPDIRQDWSSFNTEELTANIVLRFQSDYNDRNTIDHIDKGGNPFYPGTILQASHQQISTLDKRLVMLKGLTEINIPASRGVAKDKLTFIEKAVKDVEEFWEFIETATINVGIAMLDGLIFVYNNVILPLINALIALFQLIIWIISMVTKVINLIIDAINLLGADINTIPELDDEIHPDFLDPIDPIEFESMDEHDFDDRLNALLLENDMVTVPKIVMVDTSRDIYKSNRIAYLHAENRTTVHAEYLWKKFYFIEAFVDPADASNRCNRFTLIDPALNSPDEKNKVIVSLQDFLNLIGNPQFNDQFGEQVLLDSILLFPEQNQTAELFYRKSGWLAKPQHPKAEERSKEINTNLTLKLSIPNGQ